MFAYNAFGIMVSCGIGPWGWGFGAITVSGNRRQSRVASEIVQQTGGRFFGTNASRRFRSVINGRSCSTVLRPYVFARLTIDPI